MSSTEENSGVSPVIGIILIIFITVIISSVLVVIAFNFDLSSTGGSAGVQVEDGNVQVISMGNSDEIQVKKSNSSEYYTLNEVGNSITPKAGVYNIISEKGDSQEIIKGQVLIGEKVKVNNFQEKSKSDNNIEYSSIKQKDSSTVATYDSGVIKNVNYVGNINIDASNNTKFTLKINSDKDTFTTSKQNVNNINKNLSGDISFEIQFPSQNNSGNINSISLLVNSNKFDNLVDSTPDTNKVSYELLNYTKSVSRGDPIEYKISVNNPRSESIEESLELSGTSGETVSKKEITVNSQSSKTATLTIPKDLTLTASKGEQIIYVQGDSDRIETTVNIGANKTYLTRDDIVSQKAPQLLPFPGVEATFNVTFKNPTSKYDEEKIGIGKFIIGDKNFEDTVKLQPGETGKLSVGIKLPEESGSYEIKQRIGRYTTSSSIGVSYTNLSRTYLPHNVQKGDNIKIGFKVFNINGNTLNYEMTGDGKTDSITVDKSSSPSDPIVKTLEIPSIDRGRHQINITENGNTVFSEQVEISQVDYEVYNLPTEVDQGAKISFGIASSDNRFEDEVVLRANGEIVDAVSLDGSESYYRDIFTFDTTNYNGRVNLSITGEKGLPVSKEIFVTDIPLEEKIEFYVDNSSHRTDSQIEYVARVKNIYESDISIESMEYSHDKGTLQYDRIRQERGTGYFSYQSIGKKEVEVTVNTNQGSITKNLTGNVVVRGFESTISSTATTSNIEINSNWEGELDRIDYRIRKEGQDRSTIDEEVQVSGNSNTYTFSVPEPGYYQIYTRAINEDSSYYKSYSLDNIKIGQLGPEEKLNFYSQAREGEIYYETNVVEEQQNSDFEITGIGVSTTEGNVIEKSVEEGVRGDLVVNYSEPGEKQIELTVETTEGNVTKTLTKRLYITNFSFTTSSTSTTDNIQINSEWEGEVNHMNIYVRNIQSGNQIIEDEVQVSGNSNTYTFNVPEPGYYDITLRPQTEDNSLYKDRQIKIGETTFSDSLARDISLVNGNIRFSVSMSEQSAEDFSISSIKVLEGGATKEYVNSDYARLIKDIESTGEKNVKIQVTSDSGENVDISWSNIEILSYDIQASKIPEKVENISEDETIEISWKGSAPITWEVYDTDNNQDLDGGEISGSTRTSPVEVTPNFNNNNQRIRVTAPSMRYDGEEYNGGDYYHITK